jgi:calcineurin-like phosphoesterase
VITLGDHAFDQKDMLQFIETEPRILRPLNFANPRRGGGTGCSSAGAGARCWWRRRWARSS